ncbi:MAG: glutamine--tRNA ligase/YqeY domain fusion protein [Clostridia bacterium]|nr:glutamine--tRNA ligase/YqeY domain fusion protein [Clostridia bacterium]
MSEEIKTPTNFIHDFIEQDLKEGKADHIQTRFPPEPNGYLHIGHAKAIYIDFETAKKYNGICNLRLDDTNPTKEDVEYVDAIKEDIHWLGFEYANIFYASDYYDFLLECAYRLINKGLAYVCDLTADEIREYRGTLKEPGRESPYRNRTVEENLDLFNRMKAGEFPEGSHVLRAKIDMASNNLNMRDPVIYRILFANHHRTGEKYCVYPMYDFAHPLSDSYEGVTHSLCSLEFEDHRPLYDWVIKNADAPYPSRQIEFARLNMTYTVMSKRKLRELIEQGIVSDWDDPRLPTLRGIRRLGYPPEAVIEFIEKNGVSKTNSVVDYEFLEFCVRNRLSESAKRVMAVLDPVKLVIDNYPENEVEYVEGEYHPDREDLGKRSLPFSRELYIERTDFTDTPPKGYYRLFPGNEVRLRHAYYVTCTHAVKDENGNVVEVHATYDPATKGGWSEDGRKVRGTIHWVSAAHAKDVQVDMYERLFKEADPDVFDDYHEALNPNSKVTLTGCKLENSLGGLKPGDTFQFMRHGYFCVDKTSTPDNVIFNRTVALKDSFKKKK